jgi:hypothetical protein
MKTESGTSSESYVSQMAATASPTPPAAATPTPEDPPASFEDLLLQQETAKTSTPASGATDWQGIIAGLTGKTPTVPAPGAAIPPVVPTPGDPTALEAAAGPAPGSPVAKTLLPLVNPLTSPVATAATPAVTLPAKGSSVPLYTGSSVFMAHSAILAAQTRQASTGPAPAKAETDPSSEQETTAAATLSLADEFGLTLPVVKSAGKAIGSSTTEKKSDASTSQGSFLQADTTAGASSWAMLGSGAQALPLSTQDNAGKQVTSLSNSPAGALKGASGTASAVAGMANGKTEKEMNATLDLPDLVVSTGTNPMVMKNSADVSIQLGTNHDFKDALGQVMRVAELSGLSNSTPPLRVAIEIQTPPGAIVNVYVSKQSDGYRAQLSANDPQALSWVQDQIGSLRQSTDTGVSVRWLPAQMETSASSSLSTASSGSESGLSWDRGGQGQQGNSQSNERQNAPRQKRPLFEGLLSPARSNSFLETVGVLGRAA